MTATRKNISFAEQVVIDRHRDPYVYGGNWDPFDRQTGTDCSGAVTDILDAASNGTAMEWTRHGLSTESWRPPSMGGAANPANGPFGTVMVNSPDQLPADAAVWVAFHHGPGGGANSHTWCQIAPASGGLKTETMGGNNTLPDGGTVIWNGTDFTDDCLDVHTVDGVNGQYGANNWWYLPGPVVEDGTPVPHQPSGVGPPADPGEAPDTLWADVSEFQTKLDQSYFAATYQDKGQGPFPFRVISIRTNDGDHMDANFAANYAAAKAAADAGQCEVIIVYYYWRPGTDAVNNHMAAVQANGGPHPKHVSMIDLESGGNPGGDKSGQVNSDYQTLSQWLGSEKRVIGYANLNDLRTMWQFHPAAVPMILAGYGSNPNDPSVFKIGHQYTDGTGYGDGLPEGAPPFGNCDMNSADGFSPSQLATALGVSDAAAPIPVPDPTPVPPPGPAEPPTFDQWRASASDHDLLDWLVQQVGPGEDGWASTGVTVRDKLWEIADKIEAPASAATTTNQPQIDGGTAK